MPKRKKNDTEPEAEPSPEKNKHKEPLDSAHPPTSTSKPLPPTSSIPYKSKQILYSLHKPHTSHTPLIFTHGAGGGISAPATSDFASGFATQAPILCFQGSPNLTQRVNFFNAVIDHQKRAKSTPCPALGGRSMGARAAVLTALERGHDDVKMLVLVSYPLLAAGGKREYERREKILLELKEGVDVLFVLGREDEMCEFLRLGEMRAEMKARSWLCVVEGADHGMGWKGKAKVGEEVMRRRTGEVAARWMERREGERTECEVWWDGERGEVVCGEWRRNGDGDLSEMKKTKR
ncbi:uncharacterized protein MYCFIDRAFT_211899 [Pseudocercospora fijiensis CIRAD86]|uniref:KANL3/Tex30 alpha/beta hydrolase-like domain-containing protein n=1 Tax=Pseudocercospora fijiensis (strain CIRAD86) TaxID=383855 RepID=M3AS05_PSEFD|nr:uncharacterized protein MYCFIDRAFT_211899 [Pseudocercospora fijiensis CIRAD86]EME79898.1 hypothetical protein MYCFIDRAFT_211899 [Pseudocercospora fijiensis CIRAD86]